MVVRTFYLVFDGFWWVVWRLPEGQA